MGMTSRNCQWLSGLFGLALAALLTIGVVGVVRVGLPPLIVSETGRFVLLLFVLFFSLVEIPLMIFALRKLVTASTGPWVLAATHAAFVFFAAFYAAPYTLLTGQVGVGLALSSLSILRLTASIVFVSMQ
jgi:hypothetical protein